MRIKRTFLTFTFLVLFANFAFANNEDITSSNIPVEYFFKDAQFSNMVISPDGKHIAAIYDDVKNSTSVAIMDIELTKILTSINLGEYRRIFEVMWPRNDRIIIQYAKFVGYLDDNGSPPIYVAYDIDGKNGRQLTQANVGSYQIVSLLPNKPNKILVSKRNRADFTDRGSDFGQVPAKLFEIDIDKGKERYVGGEPRRVNNILADTNGIPRMAFGYTEDRNDDMGEGDFSAYLKPTPKSAWTKIDSDKFRYQTNGRVADVKLLGFSSDNKQAYISSDYNSSLPSIYAVDMKTQRFSHIYTPEKVTIGDPIISFNGGVEGFTLSPDFNTHLFLTDNSEIKQIIEQLYVTFGITEKDANLSFRSASSDGDKIVFELSSDKNPGEFYLFNRGFDGSTPNIRLLSETKPEINPKLMASLHPLQFQSRDGLEINGYYMLPTTGSAPYPMVQIVHGGPHGVRDSWGWNREAQFLASRGYAVVFINFRGSGGYGIDFIEAGHEEWGGKMINDMTDATDWMVKQGFADENKLCIYGGSYGGYAVLQSMIREPDLYKCGIGYVGVYSLFEFKKSGDIPKTNAGKRYLDRVLGTDKDQLHRFSPAYNVSAIKGELFIAHGSEDERVPMPQYDVLSKNLKQINKPYLSMIKAEGHGYQKLENKVAFYSTMEKFLSDSLQTQ